jgi:hypothetical protein
MPDLLVGWPGAWPDPRPVEPTHLRRLEPADVAPPDDDEANGVEAEPVDLAPDWRDVA